MLVSKFVDLINIVMLPFGGLFFIINLYYMSYNKLNKKSYRFNIILGVLMIIIFSYNLYQIFLAPVEPL